MLIKNWLENKWFANKSKKNTLVAAIFQGERKRKERLACIRNELKTYIYDELNIEIPENIILMLPPFLPKNNVSEERTALIKQAKQKFNETKLPSLLSVLSLINTYLEKIMKNEENNE